MTVNEMFKDSEIIKKIDEVSARIYKRTTEQCNHTPSEDRPPCNASESFRPLMGEIENMSREEILQALDNLGREK